MWLLVPSGTMPTTSARSPPTLAAIEVMGATVVATVSRRAGRLASEAVEPQAAEERADGGR